MPRLLERIVTVPLETSHGVFRIDVTPRGLAAVRFPQQRKKAVPRRLSYRGIAGKVWRYFKDPRKPVGSIPLDLSGHTTFEKRVYGALRHVPPGRTITYAALARRAGYPGAARAVGTAMRKNRVPIVVPCHRVLPARGGLGGYAAGRSWKRFLLEREHAHGIRATRTERRMYKRSFTVCRQRGAQVCRSRSRHAVV
ncbi:MAG: methylated-DNA--[protein]-cysteine S-methyltransferase [Candidatus Omnitrophica bacterium]|nr:methylated-DNA--[protein]-cysteine S-methyltransferase [Candidatus Omnitrophota bacterium]